MDAEETAKLAERQLVVVDPEIDEDVREPRIALRGPDDEDRSRLLPATVSAGFLRGVETVEEPFGECLRPRSSRTSRRAHPPSRAETRMFPCAAIAVASPVAAHALQPSPVYDAARPSPVDHAELPLRAAFVPPCERATTSSAARPSRRSARPSGPYRGLARDCVAIAPTSGSAHGTMQPTARNFDCTATPHCRASRSQAQIEYVATTGLAVGHLREIEREQRLVRRRAHTRRVRGKAPRAPPRARRAPHDDGVPA